MFTDVREHIKQEYIANEWEYEAQKYLKWWMSDEEDRVYQQTNQGINVRSVCLRRRRASRSKKYQGTGHVQSMPENIVPVSISYRANLTRIVISGKSSIKQAETTHNNDENIL
jgi:hypothetical protein